MNEFRTGSHFDIEPPYPIGQGVYMGKLAIERPDDPASATIEVLGRFSDGEWPGKLTVNTLLDDHKDTLRLRELEDRINDYYVFTNPIAPTRCIDGRVNPGVSEAELGPQVPGGALGAALAYRLANLNRSLRDATFLVDAKDMIQRYIDFGFTPGGHLDEESLDDPEATGCGHIDKMDVILDVMTDSGLVNDHEKVVASVMSEQYDPDIYQKILGTATLLKGRSREFFKDRAEVAEYLEKTVPGSMKVLQGKHKEGLVVINYVPETTLSSNRVLDEYGIGAFGYDIWWSRVIARELFPNENQDAERHRFITARVMLAISTLMALEDGSLNILVRR